MDEDIEKIILSKLAKTEIFNEKVANTLKELGIFINHTALVLEWLLNAIEKSVDENGNPYIALDEKDFERFSKERFEQIRKQEEAENLKRKEEQKKVVDLSDD